MHQPATTTQPKRYQCRHIFTDGHRCGSPSLRREDLCYYHHTTRTPAPRTRAAANLQLPPLEDRSAIQHALGEVLHRIATHSIDPRRAGLLLYGLQIASLNLPRPTPSKYEPEPGPIVEEITTHPTLGTLAPPSEVGANRPLSPIGLLLQQLEQHPTPEPTPEPEPTSEPNPTILPTIQATEAGCPIFAPSHRVKVGNLRGSENPLSLPTPHRRNTPPPTLTRTAEPPPAAPAPPSCSDTASQSNSRQDSPPPQSPHPSPSVRTAGSQSSTPPHPAG